MKKKKRGDRSLIEEVKATKKKKKKRLVYSVAFVIAVFYNNSKQLYQVINI